jgi:hypothetical protein
MARAALAILIVATFMLGGGAAAGRHATCPGSSRFGRVAYIDKPKLKSPAPDRGGSLHVLDLGTCRVQVIVKGVQPPVRWSHDGRWIAFGEGSVVSASGGKVSQPLGTMRDWTWAPRRNALAGVTQGGGVVVGGPRAGLRRLLRDGSRADNVAFDSSGQRLAVGRDRPSQLSVFDLASGSQTVLRHFSSSYAGVTVAGWSPGGHWVLFWGPYAGPSIAADGVALHAISASGGRVLTLAKATLLYDDFTSWCRGSKLALSAGFDRYSTSRKTLLEVAPPRWRARPLVRGGALSWVTPACSPNGATIAAAAGPNFREQRFGLEHRSLWLVSSLGRSPRRLTVAPAAATDERPAWSRDGRSLLFVRTRGFMGTLYLVRLDGRLVGPIVGVGWGPPYYGHYGWADQIDWYQPR